MEHAFNTNVAAKYDVPIAIFLNNFKFWTLSNLANKKHIHDGLCWTYNTVQAFGKIFNYWTRHQIEHLLSKCEKEGLIVSSNYNDHKYDRKKWYALTAKAYKLFPELAQDDFLTMLCESISEKTEMAKLHPTISGNSELSLGKFREAFLESPKPIADINTDEKPDDQDHDENQDSNNQKSTAPKKEKSSTFDIKAMLGNNPHKIPEPMINDWLDVRKTKKNKVTPTAWNRINKILVEVKEQTGISPTEAFETMVASGWQSLELKYFVRDNGASKKPVDDFPFYQ